MENTRRIKNQKKTKQNQQRIMKEDKKIKIKSSLALAPGKATTGINLLLVTYRWRILDEQSGRFKPGKPLPSMELD